eukprot:873139-Alexandrium_andersonii.AAC.1
MPGFWRQLSGPRGSSSGCLDFGGSCRGRAAQTPNAWPGEVVVGGRAGRVRAEDSGGAFTIGQ